MGLFDIFRKKEAKEETKNKKDKDYDVKYLETDEGRLQVDFYDKARKLGQLYDTTRLVIDNKSINLADQEVQNCMVSWYNQDDIVFFNTNKQNESRNAKDYTGVLAQIDSELLKNDEEYCKAVMMGLLNKARVTRYIQEGLNDDIPERPCGNYIGGIQKTEKGYTKIFSLSVGKAAHNSDQMVKRRKEHRAKVEQRKQKAIAEKKALIQQLQNEIDEMSK